MGVRREVGADLVTDPGGRVAAEPSLVSAQQITPLPRAPTPKRPDGLGAPCQLVGASCQLEGDHVQHGAPPMRGGRRVQTGVDRLQRPHNRLITRQPGADGSWYCNRRRLRTPSSSMARVSSGRIATVVSKRQASTASAVARSA